MPWKKIANLRGPAGYNALGTEPQQETVADWLRGSSGPTALSRAVTELTGLNPKSFGAVGDGVHDDTDAIEAMFAAVIPGQAMIMPPSGSTNEFYRITRPLEITTPSVRLIGQPRDAYSVSIRTDVPGMTMLTVKAPGFVMQDMHLMGVENIADGGTNGAGASVNGVDLYGAVTGDIDAEIKGCTFQFLNVPIRTRGRNAKISDSCLFNNCLNGVVVDGEDVSFHTSGIQNRGNTIVDCRFHNIGISGTNSAVEFTPAAKVIHAIVQDNFFDSNGYATHVRAIGTSGASHQRISCIDNIHTELLATAYDFKYVNNWEISSPRVYGYTAGEFSGHAIVVANCVNFVISDPYLYQIGGSGIVGTDCTDGIVRDLKARSLGMGAGIGHGLDFDATNTFMTFDSPNVSFTDGWGFTGEPANSSMTNAEFTSCTLGKMNSRTLVNTSQRAQNAYVEGKMGRFEDVGFQTYDFAAGAAKTVATVAAGGSFTTFLLEVEITGNTAANLTGYLFAKRVVNPANGAPTTVTVGADVANQITLAITTAGANSVNVVVTPTNAIFGSVKVRTSAVGATNGTNRREAVVSMA